VRVLACFLQSTYSDDAIEERGRCGLHKSVLIVDDEQLLARTLSTVLREAGYRTVVAGSAEEAERYAFGESPMDLIVVDVRLPRESGLEMVKRLRERALPSKVILMTAYETPDVKSEARRLKVDRYLKKPFDLTALVDEVRSLIGDGGNPRPE
jgi:DNA-binding response OmpR family regulator